MSPRRTIITTIVLYAVACALPAVYFDEGGGGHNLHMGSPIGLAGLVLGWFPPYTVAWAANFPFIAGCILFLKGRYKGAMYAAGTAALLALTTWFLVFNREIPRLLPGYYLWQASFIVLTLNARALWRSGEKKTVSEL